MIVSFPRQTGELAAPDSIDVFYWNDAEARRELNECGEDLTILANWAVVTNRGHN